MGIWIFNIKKRPLAPIFAALQSETLEERERERERDFV